MDEAQLVEMPNGDVVANMRNRDLSGERARGIATSRDGGATFGEVTLDQALPDPTCQATVLRSGVSILFANPGQRTGRVTGALRRSDDGGKTWRVVVEVATGYPYAYSCLVAMPADVGDSKVPQTVGLLWETALPGGGCKPGSSACHILFSVLPSGASTAEPPRSQPEPFVHPGVFISKGRLEAIRASVHKEQSGPRFTAYNKALMSPYANLTYTPRGPPNDGWIVCGSYSNPDIGCSAEAQDSTVA